MGGAGTARINCHFLTEFKIGYFNLFSWLVSSVKNLCVSCGICMDQAFTGGLNNYKMVAKAL